MKALALILLALVATGCASVCIESPEGWKASSRRFLWASDMGALTIQSDRLSLTLTGFTSATDSSTAGAITEGATSALGK